MSTITGDVLLTSAFMAYAGYFDQQFRHSLFASWASHLKEAHVSFRQDLARSEVSSRGRVVVLLIGHIVTINSIISTRC